MDKKDIVEEAMYTVMSPFEFDGETFDIGHEFKILKIIKNATDISYLSIECEHALVHGHNAEGLGKDKHCWDVDQAYIIENCKLITVHAENKKEPITILKRYSKKEFTEALKIFI